MRTLPFFRDPVMPIPQTWRGRVGEGVDGAMGHPKTTPISLSGRPLPTPSPTSGKGGTIENSVPVAKIQIQIKFKRNDVKNAKNFFLKNKTLFFLSLKKPSLLFPLRSLRTLRLRARIYSFPQSPPFDFTAGPAGASQSGAAPASP